MTGTPGRILVVDDSQTIRMRIREELEEEGYEVIEARNGLEALIQAASTPAPDLITLDIEMPKMTGFETCRKLRESHYARFFSTSEDSRIPVVFITGNDTIADRKKGFELGAVEFIVKPFQKGEVLNLVRSILNPQPPQMDIQALVADDSSVARKITSLCLKREGIRVLEAEDGFQAIETLRSAPDAVDIVVTDLVMPNLDGMQLCRHVRQELGNKDMPIIVLTAMSDLSDILEVFKAGASDYLVKPYAKEELLARIKVHIERNRVNRELRKTITLLKEANDKIERLSIRDPLTGCFNRGFLSQQLENEIKRAIRYKKPLSIVLADIDYFKKVNDTYGHQAGDAVLIRFVDILQNIIRREVDWIARYGGEEFLIVLPETAVSQAGRVAEKLRNAVACTPLSYQGGQLSVTASFGATGLEHPNPEAAPTNLEQLLKTADDNLYQAKDGGRNRVVCCAVKHLLKRLCDATAIKTIEKI